MFFYYCIKKIKNKIKKIKIKIKGSEKCCKWMAPTIYKATFNLRILAFKNYSPVHFGIQNSNAHFPQPITNWFHY